MLLFYFTIEKTCHSLWSTIPPHPAWRILHAASVCSLCSACRTRAGATTPACASQTHTQMPAGHEQLRRQSCRLAVAVRQADIDRQAGNRQEWIVARHACRQIRLEEWVLGEAR